VIVLRKETIRAKHGGACLKFQLLGGGGRRIEVQSRPGKSKRPYLKKQAKVKSGRLLA
jgi:hypothetical protein